MRWTEILAKGTPGVVRSYTSGIFVGRLVDGEDRTVVLQPSRWLREWDTTGKGSIYDLIESDTVPQDRGPLHALPHFLTQADFLTISDEAYERLIGD